MTTATTQYFNANTRWHLLTHEGHIYKRNVSTTDTWKCYLTNCPGTAETFMYSEVIHVTPHCHGPNYHKIAAEFVKTKLVEWGMKNSDIREKKHFDVIYDCLSSEVLQYLPKQTEMLGSIGSKRRRYKKKGIVQEKQQGYERFIFPMDEIKDLKVAELLVPSAIRLNDYYLKNGIIELPSGNGFDSSQFIALLPPANQQQQNQRPETSVETQSATTVSNIISDSDILTDNEISTIIIEINDNGIPRLQYQNSQLLNSNENDGTSANGDAETPPILEKEVMSSFDDNDFDYCSTENQDLSLCNVNSVDEIDTVIINAASISPPKIVSTSAKQLPRSPRLEKTINALHQRQHLNLANNNNSTVDELTNSLTAKNLRPSSFIENIISSTIEQCQQKELQNSAPNILENIDESLGNWCKVPDQYNSSNSEIDHLDVPSFNAPMISDVTSQPNVTDASADTGHEPILRQTSVVIANNNPSCINDYANDSFPTIEYQNIKLTNKFLLNILSNPNREEQQHQLDEYQKKLITEMQETSKIVQKIMDKMLAECSNELSMEYLEFLLKSSELSKQLS